MFINVIYLYSHHIICMNTGLMLGEWGGGGGGGGRGSKGRGRGG